MKFFLLASAPKLRQALKPAMRARGVQVLTTGVYLGVDMPTTRSAAKRKREVGHPSDVPNTSGGLKSLKRD